jgi:hypothetical protein
MENETTNSVQKKHPKLTIPTKEAGIITLAKNVIVKWDESPKINLAWTDVAKFKASVTNFEASFSEKKDETGSRSGVTSSLKMLNKEIDKSIKHVKNYIAELFPNEDVRVYYSKLGIEKENNQYRLPLDKDKRLHALEQLLKGIETYKLSDKKFGKVYWEDTYNRFSQLKAQALNSDSMVSQHVSTKIEEKPLIRKTLNAIVLLIKANYPDTWHEELRVWGFQKEKY